MEVSQAVAFVVVLDGVGKDHVVGGVRPQRVLEFDDDGLSLGGVFGLFGHRRGDEHVLRGVVEGDELVEVDADLFPVEAHGAVCGLHFGDFRRGGVLRPARRCGDFRAAGKEEQRYEAYCGYGRRLGLHWYIFVSNFEAAKIHKKTVGRNFGVGVLLTKKMYVCRRIS